ncbi:MAG: transglutaminase family protein [Chloroflexota bacterium]|nr:transglutaminase family protein [Chloroflexota bacterium]
MEIYLTPTVALESSHPVILETAHKLTLGCENDAERVAKLFYFVRDSISYNIYMISVVLDDFKAATILERGKGYCVQKAVLLATLGRAAGIPSRLAFAAIRNHKMPDHLVERLGQNIAPRHGYNQFFIEGKWVTTAPTFDRKLCEKIGVPAVEFDGIHDATLPEKNLIGEPYIEYVEKFGHFADLPLDWIAAKISKVWGTDKRAWLDKQ